MRAAGFPLAVTDVRAEACAPIVSAGATAVSTAAAVAERAAIVITRVPGPKEVEEATAAADAYGITRSDMVDVLRHSVGGTPLSTHWEERLLTGDPAPGFEIARVLKDLRLGAQAYADLPYDAPIFAAALAAYESAAANGHAGDDVTAVLQR